MKKIFTALLVLSAFSAFAGTKGLPSEDPVVKSLRTRFLKSVSPTAADLLKKNFHCRGSSAIKGDFQSTLEFKTSFESHDGMFLQDFSSSKRPVLMADNGKEVLGVISDKPLVFEAIRATAKGDLIIEWSKLSKSVLDVEAIADIGESTMIFAYFVCVPEKKN